MADLIKCIFVKEHPTAETHGMFVSVSDRRPNSPAVSLKRENTIKKKKLFVADRVRERPIHDHIIGRNATLNLDVKYFI